MMAMVRAFHSAYFFTSDESGLCQTPALHFSLTGLHTGFSRCWLMNVSMVSHLENPRFSRICDDFALPTRQPHTYTPHSQ
jgi:hypothetical protein